MRSIKQIALTLMVTIGAFTMVTYTACTKDACAGITCSNVGTCSGGTCTCNVGYEGASCQIKSNAKFAGTYSAAEVCNGTRTYQVTITADGTDPTKILVSNLGNYGCTSGAILVFNGTVNQATFTIADNQCNTQMNATGTYNSDGSISVTFTATYGIPLTTDNCTVTLTR